MPSFNRRVYDFQPSFLVTQNAENQKFKETTHIYNCSSQTGNSTKIPKSDILGGKVYPFCKSFFWYPGIRLKFARSTRFPMCCFVFPGHRLLHPRFNCATTWIERPIARPRWRYAGSLPATVTGFKRVHPGKSKHPNIWRYIFPIEN